MKKPLLIFLALLIMVLTSACGKNLETPKVYGTVDAKLKPYLDTFVKYANSNHVALDVSSLSIVFSESMPKSNGGLVIGYCSRSSQSQFVAIKGSYWNTATVSDREQLLFHELGHCLLGLQHNDSVEDASFWDDAAYKANNVPSSIMNTYHFGSTLYSGNRIEYLKRLFNGVNSSVLYWNAPTQIDVNEYIF